MQQMSGGGRTNQIEQWQATTWTIELHQGEFVPKSKKHKAENVFVQSQVKKIALSKEELKSCEESLKMANIEIKRLQEANKRLSRKTVTMHNKSWSEYSAQYKRKQKKNSQKMDTKSSLFPTPGLIEGVQQSFKERLKISKGHNIDQEVP